MSRAQVDQSRGGLIEEAEEERRRILGAMILFDSEQRERYWRGWEQGRTESYAIRQRGRLYPARHMLSLAVERLRLKSMAIGVDFLRSLGFEIVALPQRIERPVLSPNGKIGADIQHPNHDLYKHHLLSLAPAHPPAKHYSLEREFEESVIAPLILTWGYHCDFQFTKGIYRGEEKGPGRIDFVVRRHKNGELVTIIEAKREIRNLEHLYRAADQAESYARTLRLSHFVVAAPEGCWIFHCDDHDFQQVEVFGADVWDGGTLALRSRLFTLTGHSARV